MSDNLSARDLRGLLLPYIRDVMGLPVRNNMTVCPLCGSGTGVNKTGAFSIYGNNEHWRCHACGAHGDLIDLVCLTDELSFAEAIKKVRAAFSISDGGAASARAKIAMKSSPAPVRSQIASVAKRNRFYSELLGMLTLSPTHAANLRQRGVPESQLWQFRSIPDNIYSSKTAAYLTDLCSKLIAVIGDTPNGVPGFYVNANGQWTISFAGQGFLVPVRDVYGRIQGIQCRRDVPKRNKYYWLSSNPDPTRAHPYLNGTGAETVVHCRFGTGAPDTLYITEGPLKADIAAYALNRTFIAIPGVNSLGSLPNVLKTFRKLGYTRVVCALDMDRTTNDNVAHAVEKIRDIALAAGMGWYEWRWDAAFKGVDDWAVSRVNGWSVSKNTTRKGE